MEFIISKKLLEELNQLRKKHKLEPVDCLGKETVFNSIQINTQVAPHKTHLGIPYTKEEWKDFEEAEYRKYVEKRSGKKSFLADEATESKNFSAETGKLKEVKYFVMHTKQDKVPVYEFPSTMVAPFTFLANGTAIDVIKYEKDGWCEILSKEGKKGFIQSSFVKKND